MIAPLGSAYDEFYFQYCNPPGASEPLDSLRQFPSADVVVDQALPWIRQNSAQPFFLWLHLMDPHAPYFPKPEAWEWMGQPESDAAGAQYVNAYWKRQDLSVERLSAKRAQVVALYDAGIRWADAQIRRLSEQLVELNLWDKCALAITADHGEEFLEHGGRFHAPVKLSQELVHVPLLIRVPGVPGRKVEPATSLIDLAPTLLDALDIPAPADFHGRSCWKHMLKGGDWTWPTVTECVYGCTNPFHPENRLGSRLLAIRRGDHKLVIDFTSGRDQLFDLAEDPHEKSPLLLDNPIRKDLLQCARKHLAESHKSRDFDRRNASQLRDLRIEWAHSTPNISN
jgi:arylsulfatase A-like enzyme